MYNLFMEAIGILYLFILFIACFVTVHMLKLAWIGLKSLKQRPEQKAEPEKKEAQKPEPVYYIVEKKRARKSTYSQPREIKFTEDK